MFETTASLGKALIDGVWRLFGVYVPGFSFTFGQLWLGVSFSVRIASFAFSAALVYLAL